MSDDWESQLETLKVNDAKGKGNNTAAKAKR
jgi:hypothetical protein